MDMTQLRAVKRQASLRLITVRWRVNVEMQRLESAVRMARGAEFWEAVRMAASREKSLRWEVGQRIQDVDLARSEIRRRKRQSQSVRHACARKL